MKKLHSVFYAALFLMLHPAATAAQGPSAAPDPKSNRQTQPASARLAKQPEFPGGTDALVAYISRELKYPPELERQGIEGRTVVLFRIMPDGNIDSIRVKKSPHPLFSEEAIRVIKGMPRWSPAVDTSGNKVAVEHMLPVTFQLNSPAQGTKKKSRRQQPGTPKNLSTAYPIEKPAQFPGGNQRLMGYIRHELIYPKKLAKKNMDGRVTLRFVVMPNGSIDSIQPLKSTHPLFTEEAVRVLKAMPWWTPAIDTQGDSVASDYTLPISFRLPSPTQPNRRPSGQ